MHDQLIEVVMGTINDYKIDVSLIVEGKPQSLESFEYARNYLGKVSYYILHDIPQGSIIDIKIMNMSKKKNRISRFYLVVNYNFKFASLVNKEDDAIGFYGRFAKGKKSYYDENLYSYKVFSPKIVKNV